MPDEKAPKTFPPMMLWLGGLLAVGIVVLLFLHHPGEATNGALPEKTAAHTSTKSAPAWPGTIRHASAQRSDTNSAEVILARKITQFSQKERAVFEALAKKRNVAVPEEVKRFFDAIDAGNWDEAQALFKSLTGTANHGDPRFDDIQPFLRPIRDAYGALMMAQRMPAQQYLDYGNAILGTLKPGMVYVGGTDPGMFIPNMMNATTDGDQHIVFTQNALADSSYLDYLNYLYGGQMKTLTADQSQQAFQAYSQDAQRRLQHDQQFPDEPRQVLPGENISMDANGKVSIGGQVAVMGINENLLQMLVQQNPDMSFAIEQSFSLKSTYAGALPLGPIMQVGSPGAALGMSADTAQQALNYWQTTTQQLLANPAAAGSVDTMITYSHDAAAEAEMLAANQRVEEAEATYNLASQLSPTNFDAIAGLSTLLNQNGKPDQAIQILNDFAQRNPTQQAAVDRQRTSLTAKGK